MLALRNPPLKPSAALWFAFATWGFITFAPTAKADALACPFCSAVSQTLRQEMSAMDTVAIAKILEDGKTESEARFEVSTVLRGDKLLRPAQVLNVNYFGSPQPGQSFLIMGVDPPDLLWSSPLPVSEIVIDYIQAINELPDESLKRLEFYMKYLEHPEALLARDAYDEFASAPYSEIKLLRPKMDRDQLLEWIRDTSLPPDRKRLYLVMLGVCGDKADADLLEEMLRSDDPNRRAGLDSMIACYITLKRAEGLPLIDELFLANKDSQYADTYAAIMALRFHGTDGGVIEKDRVLESMRIILDRPELADLVIPDLARWEDWTQVDKLVELFKTADEKSSWVRVPVINYLRACPLPEAEEQLEHLKDLDPAAFKRATSFFPVPKASSSSTDGTSTLSPTRVRDLASDASPTLVRPAVAFASAAANPASQHGSSNSAGQNSPIGNSLTAAPVANRFSVLSVISMSSTTLWLAMWLAIGGAGRPAVKKAPNGN